MILQVFKDEYNNGYQIRTKNQASFVQFDDEEKEKIFLNLVEYLQKKDTVTIIDAKQFLMQKKYSEPFVLDVLNNCIENDILVKFDYNKAEETIFSLQSGEINTPQEKESIYLQCATKKIVIMGDGELSDILQQTLKKYPYKHIDVKKTKDFNNDNLSDELQKWMEKENMDFILVNAQEWNPYFLYHFNSVALKLNKPWLLINGIENNSLRIGPLFYGKESGCLHCLQTRQKANMEHASFFAAYENFLMDKKMVASLDYYPNQTIYFNIISQLIQLELFYFFEEWQVPNTWRNMFYFNVNNYKTEYHTLLKLPYCEVCKPELKKSITPWLDGIIEKK